MPLNRPILDDRSYQQLRDELVARIPVYAPEWTDHNPSDPGITLIELFAFLGENLLYRFNQLPDATYLEYLRLLQIPLRPAVPALAMLELSTERTEGVRVPIGTEAKAGDLAFETRDEVRVLPVTAVACCKAMDARPNPDTEQDAAEWFELAYQAYKQGAGGVRPPTVGSVTFNRQVSVGGASSFRLQGGQSFSSGGDSEAGLGGSAEIAPTPGYGDVVAYSTKQLGPDGELPLDLDESVDGMLWVAVLAASADVAGTLRGALAAHENAPLLLNLGFVPDIRIDPDDTAPGAAFVELVRCPGEGASGARHAVQWEIATGALDAGTKMPLYRALEPAGDTTEGLSREGVVRLRLPADLDELGLFPLDDPSQAGTGDRPPLLDEELDERVLFWLRAYRLDNTGFGQIMHLGANDTSAVQSRTAGAELLGTGTGQPGQSYPLVNRQVLAGSLRLQVEEPRSWTDWSEVGSLHASGESDRHYLLDAEAGRVSFGNALRGRVPQIGERVRVVEYRYGGGAAGNVAAGAIAKLAGPSGVKVTNPLAAYRGADAETLENALERIPGELRRRDRAVTRGDFSELAVATPGADLIRAESLPLRAPERPGVDTAGAVSVVVWPRQDPTHPNAPLPDRNQIARVCAWLDARRLVTTELYVRPPRYRRIAIAVGIVVEDDHGIDAVRHWVELVLRQFLAPVPPYGPDGKGWPLGRKVLAAELEAAVLQVEGVDYLEGLKLRELNESEDSREVGLDEDQVVELAAISVESGPVTVDPGAGLTPSDRLPDGGDRRPAVPVPVIREEC